MSRTPRKPPAQRGRYSRAGTVQDTASLHEKAVQALAKGDVPPMPRKARKTAPVEHPQYMGVVNHRLILEAKRIIANSTYTRWEALGEFEVLVK